jgi:dihydrofolate reductase
MGRRTFEYICAMGEWRYRGKQVYVLSSRRMTGLPETVIPVPQGLLAALQFAREGTFKDIWIVGGAVTMQSALEAGVVDLIDIFVVPVLLGGGLSLMSDLKGRHTLLCDGSESYPDGVVRLRYRPQRHPPRLPPSFPSS